MQTVEALCTASGPRQFSEQASFSEQEGIFVKRFIQSSRIVALAALVTGGALAAVAATVPPAATMPRAAQSVAIPERPGGVPAQAPHQPTAIPPSGLSRQKASIQARRQKFMEALKAAGIPGKGSTKPMDTPAGSAVKFPGFAQADAMTRGVPAADRSNVVAVVTADVNKDGRTDIVNVQLNGHVSVLLNPGGENLRTLAISSENTSAVGNRFVKFATAADVNGDGYPDLLALDYSSNSVLVFLNQKDGTFGAAQTVQLSFLSGASLLNLGSGGMAVGDFNGDGALDLAAYVLTPGYSTGNSATTAFELVIYPGNGDGTFKQPLEEQYTLLDSFGATMPGQAAIADVNRDGNLDLLIMAGGFNDYTHLQETYVMTLLGDGAGGFTHPPIELPTSGAIAVDIGDGAIAGGMKVVDLDGDGNLDVLFANCENQNLYESLGNGDGTFHNSTTPITTFGYPNALAFADVTGDGIIDTIEYGNGYTAIYAGLGKGKFAQTPTLIDGSLAGLAPGEPADFDGDGQLDIARTDQVTGITSIFLQKNGVFHVSPVLSMPGSTPSFFQAVAKGDFNGDGVPDVVAIDNTALFNNTQQHYPYPDIVVGLNDGKGNFTYKVAVDHETLYSIEAGDSDSGLLLPETGDLNGDGISDLLINTDQGLYVALSSGPGEFGAPKPIVLSPVPQCNTSRIDIGDLNGDDKKDIVVAYPGDASCYTNGPTPSGMYVLTGNGDGTFTAKFTPFGASAYLPKLIDFNGDGKLDLALADDNSDEFAFDFMVVPGNGDGTFNFGAATHPLPSGTAVTSIAVGDFNKDGKQDLTVGTLFRNFMPDTTGAMTLAGNGDFTFGEPKMYPFGAYPYALEYADFNGDGKPDLAMNVGWNFFLGEPFFSNFGYLINQGDGTFGDFQSSVATTFDLGGFFYGGDYNGYASLLVDDFNGDGAVDALSVLNYDGDYHISSTLFLNAGAVKFALKAAATQVDEGSPITLTATVAHSVGAGTPTGKVEFYDNGALVDTEELSGGVATYVAANPAVGAHAFTASYSGDDSFNAASAGAAVNVSVQTLAPAFSLDQPTPSILSVLSGSSGTVSLKLSSNATFNGKVSLSCSGAPDKATCTIEPGSVTLAGNQTATATLKLTTTGTATAMACPAAVPGALQGAAALAGLLMLLSPGRIRRARRIWLAVLVLGIAAVSVTATGCGGDGHKTVPGTPTGQSTLTVTATSGGTTQTQTITLNVQ
jgi:hypothetical protein